MLHLIKKPQENAVTLVELLAVVIIIGILAAIAIPVYSAQRARAEDAKVVSDVRNVASLADGLIKTGNDISLDDITRENLGFTSSPGVEWNIFSSSILGGYCITGMNPKGSKYKTDAKALTYDSVLGGLGREGGACNPVTKPEPISQPTASDPVAVPAPTSSPTSSSTPSSTTSNPSSPVPTPTETIAPPSATPTVTSSTGTVSIADTCTRTGSTVGYTIPSSGIYRLEAWGAQGGGAMGSTGGKGAYASGVYYINSGTKMTLFVGRKGCSDATRSASAGGGGGTAIVNTLTSSPYVVAGGGGGAVGGATGVPGSTSNTPNISGVVDTVLGILVGYGGGASGTGSGGGSGWDAGKTNYPSTTDQTYGGAAKYTGGEGAKGGYANDTSILNQNGSGGWGYGGGGSGGWGIEKGNLGGAGGGGGYTGGSGSRGNVSAAQGGGSFVAVGLGLTSATINNTDKARVGGGRIVITRIF